MTTMPILPALLLLATLCATSAQAQAQQPAPARAEKLRTEAHQRFGAADTNVDGRLTRDEAKGHMPWVYRNFDAIDTAHTGAWQCGLFHFHLSLMHKNIAFQLYYRQRINRHRPLAFQHNYGIDGIGRCGG